MKELIFFVVCLAVMMYIGEAVRSVENPKIIQQENTKCATSEELLSLRNEIKQLREEIKK